MRACGLPMRNSIPRSMSMSMSMTRISLSRPWYFHRVGRISPSPLAKEQSPTRSSEQEKESSFLSVYSTLTLRRAIIPITSSWNTLCPQQRSVEKCWRESQWISCISKVWINETHVKNLKEAKPKEGTTRIPSRWSAEKKRTSGEFSQPEDRSISDIDLHLKNESSSHSVTLSFRHQSSILLECQKHVRISGESLWTSQPLKPLHRPKGMQREREKEESSVE